MYCEEDVVEECYKRIKNILKELTQYEHEIIIVDDSPKDDGSLAIIRSFNDERIKYIKLH